MEPLKFRAYRKFMGISGSVHERSGDRATAALGSDSIVLDDDSCVIVAMARLFFDELRIDKDKSAVVVGTPGHCCRCSCRSFDIGRDDENDP